MLLTECYHRSHTTTNQSIWFHKLSSRLGKYISGQPPAEVAPKSESPVTEEKYNISLQVDKEFMELFQEAKALSGGGNMEEALKKVMGEYVKRHSPRERQKRREAKKRKPAPVTKSKRYIPRPMRDQVFLRDGNQCMFVSDDGVRCTCKERLQVDHIIPVAAGGVSELSNLRLLCASHNLLMAERAFGQGYIQRRIAVNR